MPFILRISQAKQNAKLKCMNIDTTPTFDWHYSCVGTVWVEFTKIKGTKIILHVKLPIFRTTNLKGFTVGLVAVG